MTLPVLNSFYCCSLRTTSLIIGYFGVLTCVGNIATCFRNPKGYYFSLGEYLPIRVSNILPAVIYLILPIVKLIFYCILIIGGHARIIICLRIFVVGMTVMICIEAIICLMNYISAHFIAAVSNLAIMLIHACCIIILRSFYLELESEEFGFDQWDNRSGNQNVYFAQAGYPAPSAFPVQHDYRNQTYGQKGAQVNPENEELHRIKLN